MRYVHPDYEFSIETSEYGINTLVVESQSAFRTIISDIMLQINGKEGQSILSDDNIPLDMARKAELLIDPIGFDINRKSLLTKIVLAMERASHEAENYITASQLIAQIELFVDKLAFDHPCDIQGTKLNFASVLKSIGISVRDEYDDSLERLIDYMEIVREFEEDKMFFIVNLRSFFEDEKISLFMKTIREHRYNVILLESIDRPRLACEIRSTIDKDLCEF